MAALRPMCGLSALLGRPVTPGMRIGLLGGSFNPAHEGHLHISIEALRRLGLDQVWWLVSPQNPLKPQKGMASFEKRFASALDWARHPAIHVSDVEAKLGTAYTSETLMQLLDLGRGLQFVWLMGGDNMVQLPRWKNWTWIMENVPVAVLARPRFEGAASLGVAAIRYARQRIAPEDAKRLVNRTPPAWVFLPTPLHPASSTQIRHQGKW